MPYVLIGFPYTLPVIPPSPWGFNRFFTDSLTFPTYFLYVSWGSRPLAHPIFPGTFLVWHQMSIDFLDFCWPWYFKSMLFLCIPPGWSNNLIYFWFFVLSWHSMSLHFSDWTQHLLVFQKILHTCTKPNWCSWWFLQAGKVFLQNSPRWL